VFQGLINDAKTAAASFLGTYLARASVAVPFIVAIGLATTAVGLELAERFGARVALWILAGGFCVIGLVAAFVVTMKEQQQELEAEQQQEAEDSAIGEITTAAASQAASYLPAAVMGLVMQNPATAALPVARLVGRNIPLILLVAFVALLLWPFEATEEPPAEEADANGRDAVATGETGPAAASPEDTLQKAA
jgi:hypothetical protein